MGIDGNHNSKETKAKLDYLKELLTDRSVLVANPNAYIHVPKILEKEILRIRSSLFSTYGIFTISDDDLPEPEGPKVNRQTKVYMPKDPNNSFNFVGRILGPDGSTAKCLQQCLGVKIMVRGRGSMRDRKKEDANMGKTNWEHLNDDLHVVLTVEDYENRANARLSKASEYITLFLKETMKGSDKDDKVKQMQLMELSFRREPRPALHFNCNSLLDVTLPQKPGAIFPNPANLINFAYGYPTTPLFPSYHPNSPHHHHHHHHAAHHPSFDPYGAQHPHSHQPQQSQPPPPTFSGPTVTQHGQLAALSHSFPATVLMGGGSNGTGLTPTNYSDPYSPEAQAHAGASVSQMSVPNGLTMAPITYWSQLTSEYAQFAAQQIAANGFHSPYEDTTHPQSLLATSVPSSQIHNASTSIYLNAQQQPHSISRGTTEEPSLMSQPMVSDLGSRNLNGTSDGTTTSSTGLYSSANGQSNNSSHHSNKNSHNKLTNTHHSNSKLAMGLMPPSQTKNTTRRYSQKHPPHTNTNTLSNSSRSSGRSTVATVKVPPPADSLSPKANETGTKSLEEKNDRVLSPSPNTLAKLETKSEADWPKLKATVRDTHGTAIAYSKPIVGTDQCVA